MEKKGLKKIWYYSIILLAIILLAASSYLIYHHPSGSAKTSGVDARNSGSLAHDAENYSFDGRYLTYTDDFLAIRFDIGCGGCIRSLRYDQKTALGNATGARDFDNISIFLDNDLEYSMPYDRIGNLPLDEMNNLAYLNYTVNNNYTVNKGGDLTSIDFYYTINVSGRDKFLNGLRVHKSYLINRHVMESSFIQMSEEFYNPTNGSIILSYMAEFDMLHHNDLANASQYIVYPDTGRIIMMNSPDVYNDNWEHPILSEDTWIAFKSGIFNKITFEKKKFRFFFKQDRRIMIDYNRVMLQPGDRISYDMNWSLEDKSASDIAAADAANFGIAASGVNHTAGNVVHVMIVPHIHNIYTDDATLCRFVDDVYYPFFDMLNKSGKNMTLAITGEVLDTLQKSPCGMRIYGMITELIRKDQIEILGGGYSWGILPSLQDHLGNDSVMIQIKKDKAAKQRLLDDSGKPGMIKGFFPPEMAFRENLIPAVKNEGYEYLLLDNTHLGSNTYSLQGHLLYNMSYMNYSILSVFRDAQMTHALWKNARGYNLLPEFESPYYIYDTAEKKDNATDDATNNISNNMTNNIANNIANNTAIILVFDVEQFQTPYTSNFVALFRLLDALQKSPDVRIEKIGTYIDNYTGQISGTEIIPGSWQGGFRFWEGTENDEYKWTQLSQLQNTDFDRCKFLALQDGGFFWFENDARFSKLINDKNYTTISCR